MESIPIVDISLLAGLYNDIDSKSFYPIAQQLGAAMVSCGFAYIINHGVDMNEVDNIHKLSKTFFDLPTEVKKKYRKTEPNVNFHGYSGPGDEFLNEFEKNSTELREFYDIWGFQQFKEENFPSEVPGYKESFDLIRPQCNNLVKKLLRCFGSYLGLENEEFFVQKHRFMDDPSIRTSSQFRTSHYYPLDPNDPSIPPKFQMPSDVGNILIGEPSLFCSRI